MKLWRIAFVMLAAFYLASCKPSARQTVADVVQPTDSTEAVTSADTLRLVITDKHLSQTDSLIRRILKLPLDSIVVEMVNNTDCTFLTGEAYIIEQQVNGIWEVLPIRPREDGNIYAFPSIGYELAARASRRFTIHVQPDMYDFESGKEYRIGKEYSISRKAQTVYDYFTIKNE